VTETLLYWGLGLLFLSIVLIVLEVFLPSAGVISVISVTLAVVGIVCLFRYDWRWGTIGLLGVLVLGPTAFFFGLQLLPSTTIGRRLIGEPPPEQPPVPDAFAAMVNAEGEALTDLRPGGFIRVDETTTTATPPSHRVQAISEVAFIAAGTRVRITGADGLAVRVRPVDRT
jgi:membrane-bound ClpP family serine protease